MTWPNLPASQPTSKPLVLGSCSSLGSDCSCSCSRSTSGPIGAPAATIAETRTVESKPSETPTTPNTLLGLDSVEVRSLVPHPDNRGNVRETYRASWFPQVPPIKQLVRSKSRPKTVRGMHFHKKQWDIWHFVSGRALVRLYAAGVNRFYETGPGTVLAIPPGVSHGFYTENGCRLLYALTEEYDGSDEFGWHFADGLPTGPDIYPLVADWEWWPTDPSDLLVSERDLGAPRLAEVDA